MESNHMTGYSEIQNETGEELPPLPPSLLSSVPSSLPPTVTSPTVPSPMVSSPMVSSPMVFSPTVIPATVSSSLETSSTVNSPTANSPVAVTSSIVNSSPVNSTIETSPTGNSSIVSSATTPVQPPLAATVVDETVSTKESFVEPVSVVESVSSLEPPESAPESIVENVKKRQKVAYFYDPDMGTFEQPASSTMRGFRGQVTHALLKSYGLFPDFLMVMHPRLATRTDLGQYHSDSYLDGIASAQSHLYRRYGWKQQRLTVGKRAMESEDNRIDENFRRFNMALHSSGSSSVCLFPGVFDYCRLYTTGTLGCASRLNSGSAGIAINWFGGHIRSRCSSASMGCFVNDVVLGVLELLKKFPSILVINISGTHCDAVEEAFYTSNRVMTLSFHIKSEKQETGDVADVGADLGEGYAVNIPFDHGVDDDTFVSTFRSVVNKAKNVFNPLAIVFIVGGALLATDPLRQSNITIQAFADPVRLVRDFDIPLLVLGGPSRSINATCKLWAFVTAVLLGKELTLPRLIPDSCDYREYFCPDYSPYICKIEMIGESNQKSSTSLKRKVMSNLDRIKR